MFTGAVNHGGNMNTDATQDAGLESALQAADETLATPLAQANRVEALVAAYLRASKDSAEAGNEYVRACLHESVAEALMYLSGGSQGWESDSFRAARTLASARKVRRDLEDGSILKYVPELLPVAEMVLELAKANGVDSAPAEQVSL